MTAGTVVITGGILATVILLCIIAVLCYCRLQVRLFVCVCVCVCVFEQVVNPTSVFIIWLYLSIGHQISERNRIMQAIDNVDFFSPITWKLCFTEKRKKVLLLKF